MKYQSSLIDTELYNIEELKMKKYIQIEMFILFTDSSKSCRIKNFNLTLISFN